jgi:hypothetical protein
MSRITTRLRRLEAAMSGPRQVRIVWSNTSDPAEWDRQIAEMIASGRASPSDEFMRVGWLLPAQVPPTKRPAIEGRADSWSRSRLIRS